MEGNWVIGSPIRRCLGDKYVRWKDHRTRYEGLEFNRPQFHQVAWIGHCRWQHEPNVLLSSASGMLLLLPIVHGVVHVVWWSYSHILHWLRSPVPMPSLKRIETLCRFHKVGTIVWVTEANSSWSMRIMQCLKVAVSSNFLLVIRSLFLCVWILLSAMVFIVGGPCIHVSVVELLFAWFIIVECYWTVLHFCQWQSDLWWSLLL
jgi:hypothetical protein